MIELDALQSIQSGFGVSDILYARITRDFYHGVDVLEISTQFRVGTPVFRIGQKIGTVTCTKKEFSPPLDADERIITNYTFEKPIGHA